MIGRSARSAAKYGHRGSRVGEASNPGPPKSLLRRRGPFALPVILNVVPRVEQSQMSTVVDSDEEPLLHSEVRSRFQSEASPGHVEVRTPPTRATQLDVINSLGAASGLHPMPTSVSDVDHEAIPDHGDSTFLDNFERDLGVVCPVVDMTIDDGERPHGGAVVPASAGGYNGRFAVLAEESEDEAEPELLSQRHRVVPSVPSTVQDPVRPTEVDMESGSRASETDTESLFSSAPRSEALPEVEVDSESQFVSVPAPAVRPSARTQSGFIALDTVNMREVIAVRACVMKAPRTFLRGV